MSGFLSLTQSLVQQAMQIVGDLAAQITYESISDSAYDTVTGNTAITKTTYNFPGIMGRFGQNEIDSSIVIATDAKLTVAFLDLPVEPKEQDNIIINGRIWKPVRVIGTPGPASWTIHIRIT